MTYAMKQLMLVFLGLSIVLLVGHANAPVRP